MNTQMTQINASLFAHIQNDAFLSGTFGLQGQAFSETTQYLQKYLVKRRAQGKKSLPKYEAILKNIDYLVQIEKELGQINRAQPDLKKIAELASRIAKDANRLTSGERIFLPGGWSTVEDGHSMVYQFSRIPTGFYFTVYNAGAGLQYHAKKSSATKELYNPTKTWFFPAPNTERETKELGHFITRLLKPQFLLLHKKPLYEDVIYNEVFTSISYINGQEIFPETLRYFEYTAGSLSGTCSERALHQLLKINSSSDKEYLEFILDFKLFALDEYNVDAPITKGAADQIRLAIENNLKILNTPGVFQEVEREPLHQRLIAHQKKLESRIVQATQSIPKVVYQVPDLSVWGRAATSFSETNTLQTNKQVPAITIDLKDGNNLLKNLETIINEIQLHDITAQYYYLDQLIAALPIDFSADGKFSNPLYKELVTIEDFKRFNQLLKLLQTITFNVKQNVLRENQTPNLNLICLSLATLQVDTHNELNRLNKLPSFKQFTDSIMKTITGNTVRNPFTATNHPVRDQKLRKIHNRFMNAPIQIHQNFYNYLNELLNTELALKNELKALFEKNYGQRTETLYKEIRKEHLEALYMLSLHITNGIYVDTKFNPIIEKLKSYLHFDSLLRKAINPFFKIQILDSRPFEVHEDEKEFRVSTPLYPSYIGWQDMSKGLGENKYHLNDDSPAAAALHEELTENTVYQILLFPKSANAIQLSPWNSKEKSSRHVTQDDIAARDYLHLRSEPQFQIPLTLDYFTRHIAKMSSLANQRYVEANLFQPCLLIEQAEKPGFEAQFNEFLNQGKRYFTKNGQHTLDSLIFLRLDYLVSQYIALIPSIRGKKRLEALLNDLTKQLSLENAPEVTYVLQQYLFLTLMACMNDPEERAQYLVPAFKAYFYLKSHTNPNILQDNAHLEALMMSYSKFQDITSQQPEALLQSGIVAVLAQSTNADYQTLKLVGTYPDYSLINDSGKEMYFINGQLGMIFKNKLSKTGVPLAIRKHSLMKHLGLDHIEDCLMSEDGTYMVLSNHGEKIYLSHVNGLLRVQKEWTIHGKKERYELKALTPKHQAFLANKDPIIEGYLPEVLKDGTIDYWVRYDNQSMGIFVRNNKPFCANEYGKKIALKDGNYSRDELGMPEYSALNSFEAHQYTFAYKKEGTTLVKLPRYHLSFLIDKQSNITYKKTGETVITTASPIHPCVAGIMLKNKSQQHRLLVPVQRFYHLASQADPSHGLYTFVHDTSGLISYIIVENYWKANPALVQGSMWHYKKSEQFVSFQIKNGEPIAETVADALYLAYLYLASNQTEKAWNILDACTTQFGGLTGNPTELKYISWICNDLPYTSSTDLRVATRKMPAYVSCQLKTMALLCDSLSHNQTFKLQKPILGTNKNNDVYDLVQYETLQRFLNTLPTRLYQSYSRLQAMQRHLEHTYALTTYERRQLLDYYIESQPGTKALGALGYEWMSLSLEQLHQERNALLAHKSSGSKLSKGYEQRLEFIENRLKKLKPVRSKSTILESVPMDLSLPDSAEINKATLSVQAKKHVEETLDNLTIKSVPEQVMKLALEKLSSEMTEDDFIANLDTYFQIAVSTDFSNQKNLQNLKNELKDFCTKTLIANRHVPIKDQPTNLPLFCNMLYRVLSQPKSVADFISREKDHTVTFRTLLNTIKLYDVPKISVYQAKDVFRDLLANPDEVEYKKHPLSPPLKTPAYKKKPWIQHKSLQNNLKKKNIDFYNELTQILEQYQKQQGDADKQIEALGKLLTNDIKHSFDIEEQAGKAYLALEKSHHQLSKRLLDQPQNAQYIAKISLDEKEQLSEKANKIWEKAIGLANEGPIDPALAKTWAIERDSKARARLNKRDLMALYSRAESAYSIERTGLSLEKAQQLHEFIHSALVHDIRALKLEKISRSINSALKESNPYSMAEALELMVSEEIPGCNDPTLMIIQHEEELILRKRQVSAIQSLLKNPASGKPFNETIEKVIPGGGKSKVILPVIAERKAQGDNLVVIEVPQSLLETNFVDLNRVSHRLFGKSASRFEFNRDSDCSPKNLKKLYKRFTQIMTSRGYLVTTGESIQSLELKYIELLLQTENKDKDWGKKVYWLDQITKLFHHHADVIMDEVHQGLWLKKKLNYTLGHALPISPSLIKNACALFRLIDESFIKNASSLGSNYDWAPFQRDLATKLVQQKDGPLSQLIAQAVSQYGAQVTQELIQYLCNHSEKIPQVVLNANKEDQMALAFFKQEINETLPHTLSQKLEANYGPSKLPNLNPVDRGIAIPYPANNTPNERGRFGNVLEAINYSIQIIRIKGISEELFENQLMEWNASARRELFQDKENKYSNLDATPTGFGFKQLTGSLQINLSDINLKNKEQIAALYQHFKTNEDLIFQLIEGEILNKIQQDNAIIHSDSFNHVDQYRSFQGVAGTPSNHTTFHHRINYDKTSSLGTDGYIIEDILDKNTPISYCDYQKVDQFLDATLSNSKSRARCRAIIDVSATFEGVSNAKVAQEIASYSKQHEHYFDTQLKHVLYFNDAQVLCAIKIDEPNDPIIIGTSDPDEINRILGSTPNERFTYYDQAHTLGSDIEQADYCHALLLADEKIALQAFIQGCKRMRKSSQTVELIVPTRLKGMPTPALIKFLAIREQEKLLKDNLVAAKADMTNTIRRYCLSLIQDIPAQDAKAKAELTQTLKQFFVDTPSLNLFELYGAMNKPQKTKLLLEQHQKQLIAHWTSCLSKTKQAPNDIEIKRISNILTSIGGKALKVCLEEYKELESLASLEVELHKELQMELEVAKINECFGEHLKEECYKAWGGYYATGAYWNCPDLSDMTMGLNSLSKKNSELFDPELKVSVNYAKTYQSQQNYIDAFTKPVFLTLYFYNNSQKLCAIIITPAEAKELCVTRNGWITTTQDTLIAGSRPEGVLDRPEYQSLREQVRFFNGELDSLLEQKEPLHWLKLNSGEKIEFYERELLPYRLGSASELSQLKKSLLQNTLGFEYINKYPFEDLSQFNWRALDPSLSNAQVEEYIKLAQAFNYVNKNWLHQSFSLHALAKQFNLSLMTYLYLDHHLNHINQMLELLNPEDCSSPFLKRVYALEGPSRTLTYFLDEPLTSFLEKEEFYLENAIAIETWRDASIAVLEHLKRKYNTTAGSKRIDACLAVAKFPLLLTNEQKLISNLAYFPEPLLLKLAVGANTSSKLLTLISSHPEATQHVLIKILENKHLTPALAKQIIEKAVHNKNKEIEVAAIRTLCGLGAIEQYKKCDPHKKDEWEAVLIALLGQTLNNSYYNDLKQQLPNMSPRLAIGILEELSSRGSVKVGLSFIPPVNTLIEHVTAQQLPLLMQPEILNDPLIDATSIAKKCTSVELRSLFINNRDTMSLELFTAIDDYQNLEVSLLEKALAKSDDIRLHHLILALNNDALTPEIAAKIDLFKLTEAEKEEFFKRILKSMNQKVTAMELSAWEDLVKDILNKASKNDFDLFAKHLGDINESLGFKLLDCSHESILDHLPILPMVNSCIKDSKTDLVMALLQKYQNKPLPYEALDLMVSKISNPECMNLILDRKVCDVAILLKILKSRLLDPGTLIRAMKQLKELGAWSDVIKANNERGTYSYLGYLALLEFQKDALPFANLKEVIRQLPNETGLIGLDLEFDSDDLHLLAQRAVTSKQIDTLLDKPNMSSGTAHSLFRNQAFSGTIKAWNWMTSREITLLLNLADNYDSLNQVLTHPKCTAKIQYQWLNDFKKRNTMDPASYNKSIALHRLKYYVEALKLKACEHSIQALTDSRYRDAAQTAFELYSTLKKETEHLPSRRFFNTITDEECKQILQNCQTAIEKAKPVLGQHRGYKQSFVDIINVLCVCLSFQFSRFQSEHWRFFKADTSSEKIVDQIFDATKEIIVT